MGSGPEITRICPRCVTPRPARDDGHHIFIKIRGADKMGFKWTIVDDVVNELRILTVEWEPEAALKMIPMMEQAIKNAESAEDIVRTTNFCVDCQGSPLCATAKVNLCMGQSTFQGRSHRYKTLSPIFRSS